MIGSRLFHKSSMCKQIWPYRELIETYVVSVWVVDGAGLVSVVISTVVVLLWHTPHRCCHCFLTVSNNPMASGLMGRHRWREALTLLSTPESALPSAFPEFLHHHIARQFKCKVSIMANQFVDITECLCEAETLCLIERRNHCLRLKQITYQDHLVKGSMHA